MEYDEALMNDLEDAVWDYMINRFPQKHHDDVVPTFDWIYSRDQVKKVLDGIEEDKSLLRECLKRMVDSRKLHTRRAGEVHAFIGKPESMLSAVVDSISDENGDYIHIPRKMGYATAHDVSLMWQDFDPDDR